MDNSFKNIYDHTRIYVPRSSEEKRVLKTGNFLKNSHTHTHHFPCDTPRIFVSKKRARTGSKRAKNRP